MPYQILLIRHAEKPIPQRVQGVRRRGKLDEHSLSVRGWQRAGALIRFFQHPYADGIRVPTHLVSERFDRSAPDDSRRTRQTLTPLSQAMGLPIEAHLMKTQVHQAAKFCHALDGVVLIAWSHECVPALARAIAPKAEVPPAWPGERFDVVWVFEPARGGWHLRQVPQQLLAGDEATGIG